MSKPIRLTEEAIKKCVGEFETSLRNAKIIDGKITYQKLFQGSTDKAKVYFTDLAWTKMWALVNEFDTEVAWHGVAERGENEGEYYIKDILVYPQTVSGATVDMDVEEYDKWIRDNIDDERFFSIKMQGHSHVNMNVSPSGTDLSHQRDILAQLRKDSFYIFFICNKDMKMYVSIYDLKTNTQFDTDDVDVLVYEDGYCLDKFLTEAKAQVKERTSKTKIIGTKIPEKKETETKDKSGYRIGDMRIAREYYLDDEDPWDYGSWDIDEYVEMNK